MHFLEGGERKKKKKTVKKMLVWHWWWWCYQKRPLAVCRSIQPGVDATLQGRWTSMRSAWVGLLDRTGSCCGTLNTPQLCAFSQYVGVMVVCLCVVATSVCNNWNKCDAETGSGALKWSLRCNFHKYICLETVMGSSAWQLHQLRSCFCCVSGQNADVCLKILT